MSLTAVILTFIYLLLFNLLIYRFPTFRLQRFVPGVTLVWFNLKFVTGLVLWMIYTFYYTDTQHNDIHKFYNDALVVNRAASEHPAAFTKLMTGQEDASTQPYTAAMENWERNFDEAPVNENRTIIRLNALLMFFSFRTYFVHVLFMCFISLLGWVWLLNAVCRPLSTGVSALALLVMLLPSVLFWTSGIMKEPLLVFGLGIFTRGLLHVSRWKQIWLLLTGTALILISKFYVLACLLPAAGTFLLFRKRQQPFFLVAKYLCCYLLLLGIVFHIQHLLPQINPTQMLINKQTHSIKEAEYFNAGSRIALPALTAHPLRIIQQIPGSIWNTLMRPYPWEGKNLLMLASALENLVVAGLILFSLWYARWQPGQELNLLLFLLAFSLSYFAIIGMCTPVLGSLVRYRAPLLPFFFLAFLQQVRMPALPALSRLVNLIQAT